MSVVTCQNTVITKHDIECCDTELIGRLLYRLTMSDEQTLLGDDD